MKVRYCHFSWDKLAFCNFIETNYGASFVVDIAELGAENGVNNIQEETKVFWEKRN